MFFDWIIIYYKPGHGVVIDNFYDPMFSVAWTVETIGL